MLHQVFRTRAFAFAFGASFLAVAACAADEVTLLSLPGNPSTGYAWTLNADSSTGLDRVEIEDRGYGPPESALIGAPAPRLFAVSCTDRGPVRLVFDYVSPDGTTIGETRAVDIDCD